MNKLALFYLDPTSVKGYAIAVGSQCLLVHAAVEINGTWHHSSESLGRYGELDVSEYQNRQCLMWNLPNSDLTAWHESMVGTVYDWQGVVFFPFGLPGNPKKFYCFEAAASAMQEAGMPFLAGGRVSGCDIRDAFILPPVCGRFSDAVRGLNYAY